MHRLRTFLARCDNDRHWLIEESWCESCGKADLGIDAAAEQIDREGRYLVGTCSSCGGAVQCEIIEIEFDEHPLALNAPRPGSGPRRRRRAKCDHR